MKTPFVQLAGLALWGTLSVLTTPNMASSKDLFNKFRTDTGKCTVAQKSQLLDEVPGLLNYSYTQDNTQIFKNRGISRETGTVIPPFTRLNCLARNNTKMLVTSAKKDEFLCGWVETDNLLEANSSSVLMRSALKPCGVIKPISIREFCSKMTSLGETVAGCIQNSAGRSVIKTKFITDNTSSRVYEGTRLVTKEKINLFPSPQSMEKLGSVKIFSILEVFDLARNTATGEIRLLVGIRGTDLKGWINYSSGTVLASNLSVYFSAAGTKEIYKSEIGVRNNEILAQRPKNVKKNT